MARRFTYGDKFKPGDWVIDTINNREVVVLGRLPADYPGAASTYEVMRPFTADGSVHVPYGLKVWHMRALNEPEFKVGDKVTAPGIPKGYIIGQTSTHYLIDKHGESSLNAEWHRKDLVFALKFQVGDKVRTIVGEVMRDQYADGSVRVKWGNREVGCFNSHELELVERPKKEPKLGSVWRFKATGERWVYLGNDYYATEGFTRSTQATDIANHPNYEEVTNNDNA